MEISDLGAIGEFVSSIAVLVTLVFLTIETRKNSKLLVRANARQTSSDNRQALSEILDGEVSELFLRGNNEGLDSLTPEERYRFDIAYCIWLQPLEQAYADYRAGLYPADHLVAYENSIPGFLSTPGGSQWWRERKVWFGHAFRIEVERLLEALPDEALRSGTRPSE
ncbi:MAG: hypothetical protein ACQGVC_05840 [Myxococcota bacterium]